MTLKKRILSVFIVVALLCSITLPITAAAITSVETDLLFIVEDSSERDRITSYSDINQIGNSLTIEIVTKAEFLEREYTNFNAIAIPDAFADIYSPEQLYKSGIRVYIYGDLTINDYIDYTDSMDFISSIPVYNSDGSLSGDYVARGFAEEQKASKVYQIICSPMDNSRGLLCTIDKDNNGNRIETYMNIILNNYFDSLNSQRATIVDSDYDISHYYFSDTSSVHLTWILYRNYDEEDTGYDYFALESRVWGNAAGANSITETTCEHALYYIADNMIDSGPESKSNAGTLSFSVDVTGGGEVEGGSISYEYDLNSSPNINRNTSNYPNSISWTVSKRLLGPSLDNDIFKFASSWASVQSRGRASMRVNYSNTTVGTLLGQAITMPSGIQTESIAFSY